MPNGMLLPMQLWPKHSHDIASGRRRTAQRLPLSTSQTQDPVLTQHRTTTQVVSQPLPGSEGENGDDSSGGGAAVLNDCSPSGRLGARCLNLLMTIPRNSNESLASPPDCWCPDEAYSHIQ